MNIAPKHNFAAKLRQGELLPEVQRYIEWQRAVRKARLAGEETPPMPQIRLVSINLDLTTACNYACGHCIDWDKLNTGVNYVNSELFESLNNMAQGGLRSVILIGGGEPTVHPKFEETVRFLKERDVKIGIVTNGSRGDVLERTVQVLSSGDWIRFSLDSGTNDTFQRMHNPRSKAVNLEGICSWVPRIRSANPEVQIGFSYIIVWDGAERTEGVNVVSNIHEIVGATRLAKQSGFSYISFKPFLTRFQDGAEVMDPSVMVNTEKTLDQISAAVLEAKTLEDERFLVLESTNLRVLMTGNWREFTRQPKTCHMMAFRQVLSPLGVFHCPAKRGVENARVAGKDAYTTSHQIETHRALSIMLEDFDASSECAEITCLYNPANWWLEELIRSDDQIVVPLPDRGDHFL
ncbi:MAG: radical SAM protein [Patescibacteria group bacterium]